MNLPITLAGIGPGGSTRDRLDPIARRATAPGETIHDEPFAVTPDLVADAILTADAIGAGVAAAGSRMNPGRGG